MNWTLVGYLPKLRTTRSAWVSPHPQYPDAPFPAPPPVEEICSVANCIAKEPARLSGDGLVGPFGYESPAAAWQAVVPELRPTFTLYAYRLAPILFRDGLEENLDSPSADLTPLPDSFERLGYDAVELTYGQSPGCSPLSCNGRATETEVNRYCLVNSEEEGVELARAFSISKPEPGPYCLVEVWRDRGTADVASA